MVVLCVEVVILQKSEAATTDNTVDDGGTWYHP